jgi:hypothetical protein
MFVFKAAVLGAGTMGGEIAQVIASADVPVVIKDVKQELVTPGWRRRAGDRGVSSPAWWGREDHHRRAGRLEEILRRSRHHQYEGFGESTSSSRRSREMESSRPCSPSSMATPGHAILASNTSALSISESGRRPRGRQGGWLPLLLSRLGMRLIEVVGRGHLRGDCAGGSQLRDADSQEPDSLARPGFVVNRC